ncbi:MULTISPECIES: GNAT family N-acetyltransferase [unclassified Bacillus (in: firmicutes)]|nr:MULTISPECIES: GNAT family N-acetyltransferase [unclassified Bacillus (in: firmicutes)]
METLSDRLLLRPYNNHDLDFLESLLTNPNIVRYIGNGQIRDQEGIQKFLNWIIDTYAINPNYGLKLILEKESNNRIGHAGLVPQLIDGKKEIEIGYWISQEYWGRGFATEAARGVMEYGKNKLKLEKMIALIQKDNTASQKVAQKIGMRIEKELLLNGKDVFVYYC